MVNKRDKEILRIELSAGGWTEIKIQIEVELVTVYRGRQHSFSGRFGLPKPL